MISKYTSVYDVRVGKQMALESKHSHNTSINIIKEWWLILSITTFSHLGGDEFLLLLRFLFCFWVATVNQALIPFWKSQIVGTILNSFHFATRTQFIQTQRTV